MRKKRVSAVCILGRNSLFIGLVLSLMGCVTPPPMMEHRVERYWEVDLPRNEVWSALLKGLVEKGVMISIIDKEDSLIVVEETMEEGAFRRLTAEQRTFTSGVARVTLLLVDTHSGKTGIYINASLQGFTGRSYFHVTSNGNLERDYFLLISNNLPLKKTYNWLDEGEERDAGEVVGPEGGVADDTPERTREPKVIILE